LKAINTVVVMVAATLASVLLAVLTSAASFFLCMIIFKSATGPWVTYLMLGTGFFTAIVVLVLGISTCWRYSHGTATLPRRDDRKFEITILLAIAGALSAGGLMLGTIFILGQVRPIWMELDDVLPAAIVGLLIGGVLGVLLGFTHRSTQKMS
jgi:hypothetical protein